MLECFKHFPTHESKEKCQVWLKKDLDPSNLQKLMYSLYIVESLVQVGVEKNSDEDEMMLEVCINNKKYHVLKKNHIPLKKKKIKLYL